MAQRSTRSMPIIWKRDCHAVTVSSCLIVSACRRHLRHGYTPTQFRNLGELGDPLHQHDQKLTTWWGQHYATGVKENSAVSLSLFETSTRGLGHTL